MKKAMSIKNLCNFQIIKLLLFSYGDCNALNTSILPIEKRFAVHYRERIYYFANEEERRIAMN